MAKFKGAVLSCKTCGAEFRVPPSRAKKAKFCSDVCSAARRMEVLAIPKVELVCRECGRKFEEHRSHAGRRKFCSRACMFASKETQQRKHSATSMEKNPRWRGGFSAQSDGYVYQKSPFHPFASRGYVLQHRLVAEQHLRETQPGSPYLFRLGDNLYLRKEIEVHHINLDKSDNRVENLQVVTRSEHRKIHARLRGPKQIRRTHNGHPDQE